MPGEIIGLNWLLFMNLNSAVTEIMDAIANAERRSEKARFLFLTYGLVGENFYLL